MFSGVSITCFTASYLVALLLEASRLFFRAPIRLAVIVGFTAAGLLAQTLYFIAQTQTPQTIGAPLSSWYHWCLMVAWVVGLAYLGLLLQRPQTALGLFLLPLVLALIGVAALFRGQPPFGSDEALGWWRLVHSVALLLGTVGVSLGFAAGLMYWVQSYRLKHKLPPRPGFRLPSLEWLQDFLERALVMSSVLLAVGLLSGLALNAIRHAKDVKSLPWTDPVVWSSGVLFLWLVTALAFNFLYQPARRGQKVAYLMLASFVFLGLEIAIMGLAPTQHAGAGG